MEENKTKKLLTKKDIRGVFLDGGGLLNYQTHSNVCKH